MKKLLCVVLIIAMLTSAFVIPTTAAISPSAVEDAVQWAIDTANDDSHGYSQANRWGNPDYDCSSFVISAYRSVGFNLSGAVHTGNMKQPFIDEGFEWIPKSKIDLSTSKYLKRGDILLNTGSHTEIYIGNNKMVGAHEGTIDDYDLNDPGDSTGKEVCPVNYSNYSNWEGILRYPTEKPLDVGTDFYAYIINNATGKYLTNDNRNVSVRALISEGEPNQVWKFERQAGGEYIIRTCFDNKVLNVSNRGTTAGTNVGVYQNTESTAKRWYIYGKDGAYKFKPQLVDLSLYVYRGTVDSPDGTNVCLGTNSTKSTQTFIIQKLDAPQSTYLECAPGTSTEPTYFWWNMTLYTDTYSIKIWQGDDVSADPYMTINDLTEPNYQLTLPQGTYIATAYSQCKFASIASQNSVKFTVEEGQPTTIFGDADQDGEVTIFDAAQIQRHVAQIELLANESIAIADTDKDGKVTVFDASRIQFYLANLIDEL